MGCYPCQCQDNRHTPEQDHEVSHSRCKDTNSTHLTGKRGKTHSTHYSVLVMIFFSFLLPFISKYLVPGKLPGAKKGNVSQIQPPCPQQVSPLVPLCVCLLQSRDFSYTYTDMTHNRIKHEPTVSTVGQEQQETHTKCARIQSLLHAFTQMNKE